MSAGESGLNALVAPMVFNEEMDIESLAQTVLTPTPLSYRLRDWT